MDASHSNTTSSTNAPRRVQSNPSTSRKAALHPRSSLAEPAALPASKQRESTHRRSQDPAIVSSLSVNQTLISNPDSASVHGALKRKTPTSGPALLTTSLDHAMPAERRTKARHVHIPTSGSVLDFRPYTKKPKDKEPEHPRRPHHHRAPAQSSSRKATDGAGDAGAEPSHAGTDYHGPLAAAEFMRMKSEIEALKKHVHDSKKTIKKQKKQIEGLNSQITSRNKETQEQNKRLQKLETKSKDHEELISTIETSMLCQICMDLLLKPFALSPCGHILCLPCLQEWFRKAPATGADADMDIDPEDMDPDYILTRPKSCPCCRAVVVRRPVPVFIVKAVSTALAANKPRGSGIKDTVDEGEGDPWQGLFLPAGEEGRGETTRGGMHSYDDDDDDYADDEEYEDDDDDDVPEPAPEPFVFNAGYWGVQLLMDHHMPGAYDHETRSIESEEEAIQVEEEVEYDDEDDMLTPFDPDATYVEPQWEPPNTDLDELLDQGFDPADFDDEEYRMLRRGCTPGMLENYRMRYSHSRGLIADLDSTGNRIFLGWNVRLNEDDIEGIEYIDRLVDDINENPARWDVVITDQRTGEWDAVRLIPMTELEGYETTDTEAW